MLPRQASPLVSDQLSPPRVVRLVRVHRPWREGISKIVASPSLGARACSVEKFVKLDVDIVWRMCWARASIARRRLGTSGKTCLLCFDSRPSCGFVVLLVIGGRLHNDADKVHLRRHIVERVPCSWDVGT